MDRSRRCLMIAVAAAGALLLLTGVGFLHWLRSTDFANRQPTRFSLLLLRLAHGFEGRDLRNTGLAGADLRETRLDRADLRGADLTEADLREAGLAGADLTGATLFRARLEGARYTAATRWPTGFDPREHGAVLVISIRALPGSVPR